ncbi:molybdopterin-dependent oxidoreductase [Bradyrhizobium sp. ISRA443]|uniref:molybdopterin-dependent oxidoreductase n=1 Tax=unclassified Bradyrhizobium TaxID=2631580 RepID=UPI00247AA066|nr:MULTISPECIES: molybdopterin-dependent oxidoreductase [unclassified Bradyrhizobium]WGR97715.1 molybdopterin-dependent oxidoreductase [Bradyrhizobium sp. ISRA436]WGS04605.1 molybdopterin-dependent oxidoreductase [Bradyrhizobium sp. ISRA437]WGS11486.1 molybdopterin-dependent oxidoreductase [Bradyrhizobium sp. ISRA443]
MASPRRLTVPLKRTNPRDAADPGWVEVSWDEALTEIAGRLGAIRAESGAEAVAFGVTTPSGTPMVDSFEWVERFIRGFGSPNLIYAVEICGWHKDYAHALTFGRGIGFPDYDNADAMVLWGHNPARTWLAQATRIADARRRGARVAVVDPKPNGSGQQADLWLRIRPGADAALALGAIRHLIATRAYDADFVNAWTNGPLLVDRATGRFLRAGALWPDGVPDNFVRLDAAGSPLPCDTRYAPETGGQLRGTFSVRARDGRPILAATAFELLAARVADYTPERVAALTWLPIDDIEAFNALFAGRPRLAYHSWTGVGQHTNATAIERAIATLYALTGACDRPGGNRWPVPPPTRALNDYNILPPEQQAKALGLAELPLGPPAKGWITARDFSRAVLDGEPYRVRALVAFGTNFVVSQGHSERNREALNALEFQVHIDMFMNPTAESADFVLPASTPWERDALKIGFEITQEAVETVQFRPRMVEPVGDVKADYEIAAALALKLGMDELFFGGDIKAGWNYQLAPLGIGVDDLRGHPEGRRFPQSVRDEKYAAARDDGTVTGFETPTRRVELYSELMLGHGYDPLPDHVEPAGSPFAAADEHYPLVLTTAKSGWFVHTSYRHVASLRRKSPDPAAEISPQLAARRGLVEGDWAVVQTRGGAVRLKVRLNAALDERVVVAEFGWWEDCPPLGRDRSAAAGTGTRNINAVLHDDARDPVSGSVPLRATVCDIRRDAIASRGVWSGQRRFVIGGRRTEAGNVVAFDLLPHDNGPLPDFLPGQHVMTSLPGSREGRAYSLTGPSDTPGVLSIAVKGRFPDEARSSDAPFFMPDRMHGLAVGDEIVLKPPAGIFTPPLKGPRPLVFLAAGIGITPFMSHLETLQHVAPQDRVPEILLLHGCRSSREHPFARRLAELGDVTPELRRVTFYSAPLAQEHVDCGPLRKGRLDLELVKPLSARRPLVYICGSPEFVAAQIEAVAALGVPRFDIFAESFVSPPVVPSDLVPRTIRLAHSEQSFSWGPEQGTLLDAANAAGVALPSGCRVGQCESCAVQVVDGDFTHLGPVDGREGQCLACQAVPLTDLTLAL